MQLPEDEPGRLLELRELRVLDRATTPGLEALVELASESFGVPIALTSLVDAKRQWFMACLGLGGSETPREFAFCHHALFAEEPLVVEDAREDERFVDNPLVVGEPFIRFYAGAPLIMPSGRILGTFCIIDRAPRRLADAEIARLQKFASAARDIIAGLTPTAAVAPPVDEDDGERRFLARLAHDLRTPIGNMMGFAELMQHETHGPLGAPEYADYVRIFRQSGSHALDLISGILSIEKSRSRSNLATECFNLSDLVRTVADSFEGQTKGRSQAIVLDAPIDDIECEADSLAVHRILNNLISNSCKYAGPGALIRIELSDALPNRAFHVAVVDDGPGIAEPVLSRLGAPFVSTGGNGSSGLGLSNVIRLAASMGCVCEIANGESGGVRAEFYKPAAEA